MVQVATAATSAVNFSDILEVCNTTDTYTEAPTDVLHVERRSPDAGTWRDISTSPSTDVRQTGLAARAPSPPPPLTPSSPSSPSISTSSTHKENCGGEQDDE